MGGFLSRGAQSRSIGKLTPARRVLLLIALVFLFWFGSAFWGGLLMLVVVVLEVGDRVVMKRDL
ncbi:MAG: hypothetical protein ACLP00_23005, partial [Terracidiphilus sp.]